MVLGSATSGVLAYLFFALVTRELGAEEAAPVSVLWTWWSFAAAALTFPLQHWVVRTVAAQRGAEGSVRRDLRQVLGVVVLVAVLSGGVTWLAREALFDRADAWFPTLVAVVTGGAAMVGVVRGVLTARHRLVAVGTTLVLENLARVLIAVALVATGDAGAVAFGVGLVAGQLMVLVWPSTFRLGEERDDDPVVPWHRFVAGAAGGQVLAQLVLNGGPVVLALVGGAPAEVTALFAVLALFRAPYTLAVGAVSPLTTWLTLQVLERREHLLRRYLLGVLGLTALGALVAGTLGWFVGQWLVRLVFGADVAVAASVSAVVGVGSALALGTLALSLLTMARGRPGRMALAWVVAVLVGAVVLAVAPGGPALAVAAAFAAAELVAFAGLMSRR